MRPAIVLFAKAPRPGRVKTRLRPAVPGEQAAALHEAFVRDTLDLLNGLSAVADIELHTDIPTDAWLDSGVTTGTQVPGDLGARMLAALERGLAGGRPRVMIVGSDAPSLPAGHLSGLLDLDADVALGPSEDGGYYAIACRRVDGRMFDGVEWSVPRTLEQTVRACEACGLSVDLGSPWYDIDTVEDLRRLGQEISLPRHTRDWFARHAPGWMASR